MEYIQFLCSRYYWIIFKGHQLIRNRSMFIIALDNDMSWSVRILGNKNKSKVFNNEYSLKFYKQSLYMI